MKRLSVFLALACLATFAMAQRVSILTGKKASAREQYAAEYLQKKLQEMGCTVSGKKADYNIVLSNANSGAAEGYTLTKDKKSINAWSWQTASDRPAVSFSMLRCHRHKPSRKHQEW